MFETLNWQDLVVGLSLAVLIALIVAQLASRVLRSVLAMVSGDTSDVSFRDPIKRRPIRIVRGLVFIVMLGIATRPTLEVMGVEVEYGIPLERITAWLFQEGLRVLLIGVLAYFTVRIASLGIGHVEQVVASRTPAGTERSEFINRLHTIGGLATNAVRVAVFGAAAMMIMQELGVNITPLLTAAGIGGLAIGFGAQNLVRDVISGFFLILEDQIHVGDVVSIDGTSGLVQAVKLRTVVLRDLSGTVHVIPNGAISTLSNMTKEFSYYVMDVGVAYKEDTDHVVDVLREVGADLESDQHFAPHILEPLEILGVNEFGDSAVNIKIRIKTAPLKQWMIGRELRRRIKKAFDARGIEIPFPHMSLYFGEASKPFLSHALSSEDMEKLAQAAAQAAAEAAARPSAGSGPGADSSDTGDADYG